MRIWSDKAQVQVSDELPEEVFSVDWSPCGGYLVVGDMKGSIHSLDAKGLKLQSSVAHKSKVPGKNLWVQAVKISPDGRFIACGVHGGGSNVEVASVDSKTFKMKHDASIDIEMQSSLAELDWSKDSALLAVVSETSELYFVDALKQKRIEPSAVRKEQWATHSCKFGHAV